MDTTMTFIVIVISLATMYLFLTSLDGKWFIFGSLTKYQSSMSDIHIDISIRLHVKTPTYKKWSQDIVEKNGHIE